VAVPYFKLGCTLEMNPVQTAAYIQSPSICSGGSYLPNVERPGFPGVTTTLNCPCNTLLYDLDNVNPISCAPDPILLPPYTNPADDLALWYDSTTLQSQFVSAGFLGFYIESIAGLDSVLTREVRRKVGGIGGGVLGPLRATERSVEITVILFACNEASMEYGMRYLIDSLIGDRCSSCDTCDAEIRLACPPFDDTVSGQELYDQLDEGRWRMKRVGVVEGPRWDSPPLETSQCFIRRATFTIAAEIPYLYKCPQRCDLVRSDGRTPEVTPCPEVATFFQPPPSTGDCIAFDEWLCSRYELCCTIDNAFDIGETSVDLTIWSGTSDLENIVVQIKENPLEFACNDPRLDQIDPCVTLTIPVLPSGTELQLLSSIEEIILIDQIGNESDGISLIALPEGIAPSFLNVRCGTYCVCISVDSCSADEAARVRLDTVHREL
jgi:hypothetical protein